MCRESSVIEGVVRALVHRLKRRKGNSSEFVTPSMCSRPSFACGHAPPETGPSSPGAGAKHAATKVERFGNDPHPRTESGTAWERQPNCYPCPRTDLLPMSPAVHTSLELRPRAGDSGDPRAEGTDQTKDVGTTETRESTHHKQLSGRRSLLRDQLIGPDWFDYIHPMAWE